MSKNSKRKAKRYPESERNKADIKREKLYLKSGLKSNMGSVLEALNKYKPVNRV